MGKKEAKELLAMSSFQMVLGNPRDNETEPVDIHRQLYEQLQPSQSIQSYSLAI